MIIPTKRFWWLVAGGILLACLGFFAPGVEWLLIPYNVAIFAAMIVTGLLARRYDFIRVVRRVDPILSVRMPNQVYLTVENLSDQPIALRLRDEPPDGCLATQHEFSLTVSPDRPAELHYTITPQERGSEEFAGITVRWLAPFGLCEVQKELPVTQPARIYPNVLAIREFELLKQKGRLDLMGVRRSRVKGLGTEFESLRDYNEDDYRTIDWKASARRDKLVVRNFEQERNQGLIVVYDIGRHMLSEVQGITKLDYTLDAGLMLMHAAERMGDQIGLLVYNDLVQRWIVPRKGRAQVAAILDTIHGLHAEPVQSRPEKAFSHMAARWKRRSLIVVFTDVEDRDQASQLAASLASLKRRHLVMVVRVSDPRLREIRTKRVEDPRGLYRRAAVMMVDEDRDAATSVLLAAGLQMVEAEPQDLSAALVSAYLVVKERSLL